MRAYNLYARNHPKSHESRREWASKCELSSLSQSFLRNAGSAGDSGKNAGLQEIRDCRLAPRERGLQGWVLRTANGHIAQIEICFLRRLLLISGWKPFKHVSRCTTLRQKQFLEYDGICTEKTKRDVRDVLTGVVDISAGIGTRAEQVLCVRIREQWKEYITALLYVCM